MSWLSEITEGLRKIILVEERLSTLADKYGALAEVYSDTGNAYPPPDSGRTGGERRTRATVYGG